MPPRITLAREDGQILTDRERMLLDQEAHAEELQMLEEVQRYRAQGVGLAGFIAALYDALTMDESQRFTREEILTLLGQALRGR